MKNKWIKWLCVAAVAIVLAVVGILGISPHPQDPVTPEAAVVEPAAQPGAQTLDEHGVYDTKDEVALYLYTYHRLPDNFMNKQDARYAGWKSGALHLVVEGKCIGGDVFHNYEKKLPVIDGTYYECDLNTLNSKQRGTQRLVWSEYWDIYYTEDHYETFEQLYWGEGNGN